MELVYSKKLEISDTIGYQYKELNLEYYLVACEMNNSCTYGIRINLTKDGGEAETAVINDISPSKDGMLDLIKLMYKNSVTPVTARDVIYDCIA